MVFLLLVFVSKKVIERASESTSTVTRSCPERPAIGFHVGGRGRLRGCPPPPTPARRKILWLARLEYRFHAWRERRARARGLTPTVTPFPGYGGPDWVRVLGRVLIVPPVPPTGSGEYERVRGWRSFASVPVGFAQVRITIGDVAHEVVADRGGVIDTDIPALIDPGWQTLSMSVEGGEPVETRVFIVGSEVRFGVVSDVDDTVMVTALPRPLLAAWNSFVVNEHARQPVPGMAVLMERLVRECARYAGRSICPPGPGTSLRHSSGSSGGISSRPVRSC